MPKKTPIRTLLTMLAAVAVLGPVSAFAQDWPQWRGPGRDGAATGFRVPAEWPEALTQRWSVEVGLGYATPLVVGERLFVFARQGEEEVMSELDPADGASRWRTPLSGALRDEPRHPAGTGRGRSPRPRSRRGGCSPTA